MADFMSGFAQGLSQTAGQGRARRDAKEKFEYQKQQDALQNARADQNMQMQQEQLGMQKEEFGLKKQAMETEQKDELEVVWSGKDELLPPRDQKPNFTWVAPKRKYTRKDGSDAGQGERKGRPQRETGSGA